MSEIEMKNLIMGLTGGLTITSAISTMNVLPNNTTATMVGASLFAAGWAQIITTFRNNETRNNEHKNHLTVLSIVTMMSAMTVRMLVDSKKSMKTVVPVGIIFMASWLLIGRMIGQKKIEGTKNEEGNYEESSSNIGLIAPILVFVSMFIVNRIERPKSIASGIGLPLFVSAWTALSIVNSVKQINQ